MGQNKRYPSILEGEIARVGESMSRRPDPFGLTEAELQSTGPRQDARTPLPVRAWIPHQVVYVEPQLIEAEAIAWTRGAVLLRWTVPGRSFEHHTWVWASAVTRRG